MTAAATVSATAEMTNFTATPGTGIFSAVWLLVLFPLVGAAVLLLLGRRANKWAPYLGTAMPIASFVFAIALLVALLNRSAADRSLDNHLYLWIPVNGFQVDASFLLDPLSITFVLLITGVGSLIHIYSIGYMAHDPGRRRFFGYLNLFVSAMLILVLADSFLLLYVGWEGVGLASYLLIGFWYYKPSAATAAKKAFVVNRVGDVGLSIAIMVMFVTFGSTSFDAVFNGADVASSGVLTAIGIMLLLGACGKSAQFPLQSWLLDAMEGPTPVSALIHAATMVTAGVYLIARSNPIFDQSTTAQLLVATVGTITLLMGAIIGCAQDDIKKVLAGSTMSQVGYMMLAVGLGPGYYALGIIFLLAHGFFKANMFLGAGSVMHGMNNEVDMRHFGGLRKLMPVTFATFTCGYLAIIGCPPFDGFWTKDRIIEAAFNKGGAQGWIFGSLSLLGAGITAFYMTRLMAMTFFGEKRWDEKTHHPHESPSVMTVPMIVLAILSLVGGYLLIYHGAVADFLAPDLGPTVDKTTPIDPQVLSVVIVVVVAIGVLLSWMFFGRRTVPAVAPTAVSPVTTAARRYLYSDAINEALLMRPGQYLTRFLVYFDARGVDGSVNGLAAALGGSSSRSRRMQTGFVRSYALLTLGGAAAVVTALLLVRVG